jgi:5-methyltetrahydrofolate corrinoid/iron sulfur protein methyltransferase
LLLAADNIQGLNRNVAEAMRTLNPAPIRELARSCEKRGAAFIDINPGYLSRRNEDRMEFLVESVQEVTSARLILDSPKARILERGLHACKRSPVLNALSLEHEKLNEILPLAAQHGTGLVLLLMDENSITPRSVEEKIALALELRERTLGAEVKDENLIFDPVLPNLSWDEAFYRISECIKTVRLMASGAIFQDPVRTMVGLSNLRSGHLSQYPALIEQTALAALAGAGLSICLANALNSDLMDIFSLVNRMT